MKLNSIWQNFIFKNKFISRVFGKARLNLDKFSDFKQALLFKNSISPRFLQLKKVKLQQYFWKNKSPLDNKAETPVLHNSKIRLPVVLSSNKFQV